MIHAKARVIDAPPGSSRRWYYLILDGEFAGTRFAAGEFGLQLGAEVEVKFHPEDQFAYLAPLAKPAHSQHGDVVTFQFRTSGFSQEQLDAFVGEVLVQGEASEDHPEAFPVEPTAPSFDDAEDAGLDGTLRTHGEPYTWEQVARAALAKLRAMQDDGEHVHDDNCRRHGCDHDDGDPGDRCTILCTLPDGHSGPCRQAEDADGVDVDADGYDNSERDYDPDEDRTP